MLRSAALAVLFLLLTGIGCQQTAWADDSSAPVAEATEAPPPITPTAEEASAETATPPVAWSAENDTAYTINTLFMFICAVLVIFMQAGFALVEVGLNSQKNAVNILFKNLMDFCVGALLFLVVGYGIMYPGADYAGKWFGFSGSFVTRDAQKDGDGWAAAPTTETDGSAKWSNTADFMFQVAFAATAATIVSGAVAGRMKFSAYLIYSAYISAIVYPISGMWKWGGGVAHGEGFQDFAGSIVVHVVGGFAGLAGALMLGPRIGRFTPDGKSRPIPGHNLTFAALGVFILLIGWYGFNPGSLLKYYGAASAEQTCYIALTTTIAACAGANVAMMFAWVLFGKPDLTMALNGCLAGLVGITANCDRVTQVEAILIGAIAGILVVLAIIALEKLRIDDPVGAVPVHAVCGLWGGIATGIFGDIPVDEMTRVGFIIVQVKWSIIIAAWAFVNLLLLFGILKAMGQLRVNAEEEIEGLDHSEHGMSAYVMT